MGRISEFDFDGIVRSVATDAYRVIDVNTLGFHATVTFRSQSGRSQWEAVYDFDAETGDYRYSENPHYPGASQAWAFGNRVRDRIKAATTDWGPGMYTPQIGDIVRVGRGDVAWSVIGVSTVSGIVMLSSTETAIQRSELASNLEPYDG